MHILWWAAVQNSGCELKLLKGVLANGSAVACQNPLCLAFVEADDVCFYEHQQTGACSLQETNYLKRSRQKHKQFYLLPIHQSSRMEQTFYVQIWNKTVVLPNAYCIILGRSDDLRLSKKNKLFLHVFNYQAQNLSFSATCLRMWLHIPLQDEGTCLFNSFKFQKSFIIMI